MGEEKKSVVERYIQMIGGFLLLLYLIWADHTKNIDYADLSSGEIMIQFLKYSFAGVLIQGITTQEIIALIKAWKSK